MITTRFGIPISVIALLAGALLGGCDRAPVGDAAGTDAASETAEAVPRIVFESLEIDFGRFLETEERLLAVPFTNEGDAELIIGDIRSSCACAIPTLERRRYAPGESGAIDLLFDPTGPGEQRKVVDVFSNTRPGGRTRLTVIADVQAFLNVEPSEARVGVLRYGAEHKVTFTLSSTDPNFQLVRLFATNPILTVAREPHPLTGEAGPEMIVEVTIPADAPWGRIFSWVAIGIRGQPTPESDLIVHQRRIRLSGRLFGELHAEPDIFRFGVKPREAFERTVRLSRPSGEPFEVLGATFPAEAIDEGRVAIRRVSPSQYDLVLTGRGGDLEIRKAAAMTVTTDVPGEERLRISVQGVVRTQPGGVE